MKRYCRSGKLAKQTRTDKHNAINESSSQITSESLKAPTANCTETRNWQSKVQRKQSSQDKKLFRKYRIRWKTTWIISFEMNINWHQMCVYDISICLLFHFWIIDTHFSGNIHTELHCNNQISPFKLRNQQKIGVSFHSGWKSTRLTHKRVALDQHSRDSTVYHWNTRIINTQQFIKTTIQTSRLQNTEHDYRFASDWRW